MLQGTAIANRFIRWSNGHCQCWLGLRLQYCMNSCCDDGAVFVDEFNEMQYVTLDIYVCDA